MSLMDLKRRAKSAQRGHKLLKDKQDGLMKQFLQIVRRAKAVRRNVEDELSGAFRSFLHASAWMSDAEMDNALGSPRAVTRLTVDTKTVMSVRIPLFSLQRERTGRAYGFSMTNALLDESVEAFERVFPLLIELAQIEKQAENMAIELETTRRRVNALEHKMIPDLQETVKYIKMKLDESERGAIVGTMRVKASIQAQGT